MSNNPNWKRQLQDKINEHNRQHGSKPKGVSNKTMHERACSLFRSFTLLRRLGYQIDLNNLAGRHIQTLVDHWTGNARLADRCRQRGVEMLERPHSAGYIEQQLSFLRVYGDTSIGKRGMVHPLADYVDDPACFKRSYAAKEDRSWEGRASSKRLRPLTRGSPPSWRCCSPSACGERRFDNVMQKAGVTRKQLGVTAHGLRHQFAQEFHVELTDVQAPVRGGDVCADPETLKAALLEIARQLGHNRPTITRAYVGSPVRASESLPAAEPGKGARA